MNISKKERFEHDGTLTPNESWSFQIIRGNTL